MLAFRFVKRPGPALLKQIISLYSHQGWWDKEDTPARAARLIRNSHCFLVVFDKDRAIGMGRAISDSASDAYLHDIMVLDEYKGRGVGSRIVSGLKKRLKADGIRWIGLIAQNGSAYFYSKNGFVPIRRAEPMMLKGNRV